MLLVLSFQHFFLRGLTSDMIIERNTSTNPIKIFGVIFSEVNITENRTPNTASRLSISAAVDGVVNFCPAF